MLPLHGLILCELRDCSVAVRPQLWLCCLYMHTTLCR